MGESGTTHSIPRVRSQGQAEWSVHQTVSTFERLRAALGANWTTVSVGWQGLGMLSPWPDEWTGFPPLISRDEVAVYADEQFSSCSHAAMELIVALVSHGLQCKTREEIKDLLEPLSKLDGGDPQIELRKWRVVLLEDVLANMPTDALHGLIALTEFWQDFGFPSDSPHEVQGKGNTITPGEYYQGENLRRLVDRHRQWIEQERASLKKQRAG